MNLCTPNPRRMFIAKRDERPVKKTPKAIQLPAEKVARHCPMPSPTSPKPRWPRSAPRPPPLLGQNRFDRLMPPLPECSFRPVPHSSCLAYEHCAGLWRIASSPDCSTGLFGFLFQWHAGENAFRLSKEFGPGPTAISRRIRTRFREKRGMCRGTLSELAGRRIANWTRVVSYVI